MEATGHYLLNLCCKLIEYGSTVHVINPVQSDALRGLYIRKCKNDSKDSFLIAELICFERYAETTLADLDIIALREPTRQRFYLADYISDVKRKVISLLYKISPECDMFGATSLQPLSNFTAPEQLADVSTDTLAAFLKSVSNRRFGLTKANEIQAFAKILLVLFCLQIAPLLPLSSSFSKSLSRVAGG